MEDTVKSLIKLLEARKKAAALYEYGKHPPRGAGAEVTRELFMRNIIDNPVHGLYSYIRYLARNECPGCFPSFKFEGHEYGCCLDDSAAIDKYWRKAFENLNLEPRDVTMHLKEKYTITMAELIKAQGIGENDPLCEEKRLVDALFGDATDGALVRYLLYRSGQEYSNDLFAPIYKAINFAAKLKQNKITLT